MTRPPVALLVAFASIASFALINPVHDTDLFWQAKFGDLAIERGGPVRTEPIYPDALGRPIVPIYGISQVWYAVVRKVGGWELVKLFDAVLWAGAFVVPAWVAQKRFDPTRGWPSAVAAAIGAFAASKFYMTRPQTFAMLGFGLLLATLLLQRPAKWKVVVGFVVAVLWQNAHPSVVVGLFAVAIVAGVGWFFVIFRRAERPWAETALMPLIAVAAFATPAGTDILTIVRENTDRVKLFGVTEWLPLFHSANRGVNFPAVVGLAVTLMGMTFRWRRLDIPLAIVALTFAALTVWSHRFVVFFAVVAVPVWVQILMPSLPRFTSVRQANWLSFIALSCLLPTAYCLLLAGKLPLWNDWLPLDGFEALRREGVKGAIFTETQWGGLLTDKGEPEWHVTHDGRYFARTKDECEWYLAAVRGEKPVLEIEAAFHPAAYFLSPETMALRKRLVESGRWSVVWENERSVILTPQKK